jgi:hypothetical protein
VNWVIVENKTMNYIFLALGIPFVYLFYGSQLMWEFMLITVFISYAAHLLIADLITNHGVYLVKFLNFSIPLRIPSFLALSTGGILEKFIITPALLLAIVVGVFYLPYKELYLNQSKMILKQEVFTQLKNKSVFEISSFANL